MANILIFSETTAQSVKNVTLEILGKLAGGGIPSKSQPWAKSRMRGSNSYAQYGASHIYSTDGPLIGILFPRGPHSHPPRPHPIQASTTTSLPVPPVWEKTFFPAWRVPLTPEWLLKSPTLPLKMTPSREFGRCLRANALAKVEIEGPRPHFITVRPNALGLPESPSIPSQAW